MPKLEIQRSVHINAAPEHVFSIISNLANWRPWNPWLVTDPGASVEVDAEGKHYSWDGQGRLPHRTSGEWVESHLVHGQ